MRVHWLQHAAHEELGCIAPWLAPGGRVVHWKPGGLAEDERAAGLAAAQGLGLLAVNDVEFRLPGAKAPRRLVVYERPS